MKRPSQLKLQAACVLTESKLAAATPATKTFPMRQNYTPGDLGVNNIPINLSTNEICTAPGTVQHSELVQPITKTGMSVHATVSPQLSIVLMRKDMKHDEQVTCCIHMKASNVLMRKDGNWASFVADFECSIGVVGTGFWRAPEILQACKDKNVFKSPEIFTKQADIYSYGMTCYEILTGKLPFEGRSMRDYDIVLNGGRPQLPEYIDDWARRLLNWCWQPNAANRPSFGDILKFLSANSRFLKKD
jgi:serine/threonine protein kinase